MSTKLRVMSFNIRYGTADDGDNDWPHRRGLVAQVVQRFDPDLLGTQEGVDFQIEYLRSKLSDYTFFGAGREDGQQRGEYVALFFRSRRFTFLDGGHFWLSETPSVAGSKSWDSRFPRMVTWCELRDSSETEDSFFFMNTHFDMRGQVARHESAKLLRRHIESLGAKARIVVTGDFNCSEDDVPYKTLLSGGDESDPGAKLVDAYRSVHPIRRRDELTRHEFGWEREGVRVDWIIHSSHFKTLEATIDRENVAGRYPSDHYPVTAVLRPAGMNVLSLQLPCR